VAIYIPVGSAHPERGNKKTNFGLRMVLGKMLVEEIIEWGNLNSNGLKFD
jgi:hypothetical protein